MENNKEGSIALEKSLELMQSMITNYAKHYLISEEEAREYLFGRRKNIATTNGITTILNKINKDKIEGIEKSLKELDISIRNKDDSYKPFNIILKEVSEKMINKI